MTGAQVTCINLIIEHMVTNQDLLIHAYTTNIEIHG